MVPPQGVGGQVGVLLNLDVILLDVHGGKLEQGDVPQGGDDVVVDDFLIAVYRCLRPCGADDVVHPGLQPVAQGQAVLGGAQLLFPMGEKIPQAGAGGVQGAVGLIPFSPLAILVFAEIHAHVVDFPSLIVRDVALHCLPRHNLYLHIFFYMTDGAAIGSFPQLRRKIHPGKEYGA